MNMDRSIIHRLLDGDIPASERDDVIRRLREHPDLNAELDEQVSLLALLERRGKAEAPAGFRAAVMQRIAPPRQSLARRWSAFFFGPRTLRWNVATAALAVLLAAAAVVSTVHIGHRPVGAPGTVTVRLSLYAPGAQRVAVAGDFNKWRADEYVLHKAGGMWTVDVQLRPGVYSYMFVKDGDEWVTDPRAKAYEDDGFGNRNAVMKVTI